MAERTVGTRADASVRWRASRLAAARWPAGGLPWLDRWAVVTALLFVLLIVVGILPRLAG